ncbi:unnamed protein product [Closterium sp. NIES-53]
MDKTMNALPNDMGNTFSQLMRQQLRQHGVNVRTWLFMLNNYFAVSGVQEVDAQQWIEYCVTLLRGPALEWWRQHTQTAVIRAQLDGHQQGVGHAAATSSLGKKMRDRYLKGLKPDIVEIIAIHGLSTFESVVASAERVDEGSCSVKVDCEFRELPWWSDGATSSTAIIKAVRVRQLVKCAARIFAVFLEEVEVEEGNGRSAAVGDKTTLPAKVSALLAEFRDIFPDDLPPGLPPSRAVDHRIELEPGSRPVAKPQWRLSPAETEEMTQQVRHFLVQGFIQPSRSPWAAPILFAPKKDGGLRMYIDYRALNAATVKIRFPVPRLEDLLDAVQGARVFSKINLRSGYHQICVTLMNTVLSEFLGSFVVVYLYDILIFSKTKEDHMQHLQKVFEVLRREQLYAKQSKCEFFLPEVEFLGHVVSASSTGLGSPTSVKELESFLGFANYYRRFVQGYASIANPLTDLLRKGVDFDWGPAQQHAFEQMKHSLTSSPTLS